MKTLLVLLSLLVASQASAAMRFAALPAGAPVRIGDGAPRPARAATVIEVVEEKDGTVLFHDVAGAARIEVRVAVADLTPTIAEAADVVVAAGGVKARLPVGAVVTRLEDGRVRFQDDAVWVEGSGDKLRLAPIYERRFDQPPSESGHLLAAGSEIRLAPGGKVFAGAVERIGVKRLGKAKRGFVLIRFRDNGLELVGWVDSKALRPIEDEEGGVIGGVIGGDAGVIEASIYEGSTLHLAPDGPAVGHTNSRMYLLTRVGQKTGWSAWKLSCRIAGEQVFWVRDRLP